MDRAGILQRLKEHETDLRAQGVVHAALFGSVARDEQRPGSDIDIMIELDEDKSITVFDYVGLKDYIAALFEGRVDVVDLEGLRPHVRPSATAEAIYAF